ncbi:hypothetical protein DOY81_003264 [Sarcophaga bullata]|nr:hypothetical protein DOY81_003264 [Sarcophaga bullata]
MKRKCLNYFFPLLLIILASFIACASGDEYDNGEDSWMDPDAWTRDYLSSNSLPSLLGKCCKCSEDTAASAKDEKSDAGVQKSAEDVATIIYLKKLITMLFNRKYLKYESKLQLYERTLTFTLYSSQLEKLEQLNDPRDLDNILTSIFENVRVPNKYCDGQRLHTEDESSDFISSMFQLLYKVLQLTKMSEIRFLLVVTAVILIIYVINNRLNVGFLTLICGSIFIYGYLHTYLECNREMEINEMFELSKQSKGEQEINKGSRFINFVKGFFSSGETQDLEYQQLKNSAKLSLGVCRPDHVFIMYFNDIFLKYLQVLLEQCSATLTTLNGSLSFPYNIISGVLLICIICYILKLTFKYILSPSAWFVHKNPNGPQITHLPNTQSSYNEDRISGENLKLLLNAINAPSYQNAAPITAVSGVEEVKEAIDCPKISTPSKDESTIKKILQNNNSKSELLEENADDTLEDLPEGS